MKRVLLLCLALSACVGAPRRPVVQAPAPKPAPPPPAPPIIAWQDRARTPGSWIYSGGAAGSRADFGTLASFSCTPPGLIVMQRIGSSATSVRIATDTLDRTVAASPAALHGGVATNVRFAASDPLLDAIIYARGKFLVAAADAGDLVLPPWPEIARVVEDCRG